MRRLSIAGVIGIMVVTLAACEGSNSSAGAEQKLQQEADFWEIDQIEKNFHEATTNKDIDQMMSLWAPNATLTVGPGETAAGVAEIRQFFLGKSACSNPRTTGSLTTRRTRSRSRSTATGVRCTSSATTSTTRRM